MDEGTRNSRTRWVLITLAGSLLLWIVFGGPAGHPSGVGQESRFRKQTPPPAHMKSAAERSEVILLEIANSLKRIESRLERLQKVAAEIRDAKLSDGPDNLER